MIKKIEFQKNKIIRPLIKKLKLQKKYYNKKKIRTNIFIYKNQFNFHPRFSFNFFKKNKKILKRNYKILKKNKFFSWFISILCYFTLKKKNNCDFFLTKKMNWYSLLLKNYLNLNKKLKKKMKFKKRFFFMFLDQKKKKFLFKNYLRMWKEQKFIHSFNWFFLKKKSIKEKEKLIRQNKKYYNFFQQRFFFQKKTKFNFFIKLKFMKLFFTNFLWQKKFYLLLKNKQQGIFFSLLKFNKKNYFLNNLSYWINFFFKNFQYKLKLKKLENNLNKLLYSEINLNFKFNFSLTKLFNFKKLFKTKILNNFLKLNSFLLFKNFKKINIISLNNFYTKWRFLLKNLKKDFIFFIWKNLLKKNKFNLFLNKFFLFDILKKKKSNIFLNYSYNNYYLNYFFNYIILYSNLRSRRIKLIVTAKPNNTFFTISDDWGHLLVNKSLWVSTRSSQFAKDRALELIKKNDENPEKKDWIVYASASVGSWTRKKGRVKRDYHRKLEMYRQLIFTLWRVNNSKRFYRYFDIVLKKIFIQKKKSNRQIFSFIHKRVKPLFIKKFFIKWKLNIFSSIAYGGTRGIRPIRSRRKRFFKKSLF